MNQKTPQVDVIIPFHRADAYLKDSILSILDSKYVSPRIILVNDSPDLFSIKDFAPDAKIKLIRTSTRGYANALNAALPHVSSRFLAFLDSDDLNDPLRLSKQIKELISNDAAISICKIRKFSDTQETIRAKLGTNSIFGFNPYIHLISFVYSNSSWVIDRNKLSQVQKWNSSIDHTLSDWYFFQKNFCKLEDKIVFLNEALYWQRVHSGQISKNVKNVDCSGDFLAEWQAYSESLGIQNMQETDCSILLFPWGSKLNISMINLKHSFFMYKKVMKAYSQYLSSQENVNNNIGRIKYRYSMALLLSKRILVSFVHK